MPESRPQSGRKHARCDTCTPAQTVLHTQILSSSAARTLSQQQEISAAASAAAPSKRKKEGGGKNEPERRFHNMNTKTSIERKPACYQIGTGYLRFCSENGPYSGFVHNTACRQQCCSPTVRLLGCQASFLFLL